MEQITIKDMRQAIVYVSNGNCVRKIGDINNLSDEKLAKCDFLHDLRMGNIRVANVGIELQRRRNLYFPPEVIRNAKDGTVGAMLESINSYLNEKADN
jgi:hypothetical protein